MVRSRDTRKVLVESNEATATGVALSLFKTIICESVDLHDTCRLALSGGTTPHRLYARLADEAIDGGVPWNRVEVFFGDERDVGPDDADSNYRMAQKTLLDHLPIPPSQVHTVRGDAPDLQAAARDYEEVIRQVVPAGDDEVPRFDLILLGMGGDGHTASLFPGSEAISEQSKLVVAHFVPVLGRNRLTFTFPLINAARNVIMLVTGEDKSEAVAELVGGGGKSDLPAAQVAPADGVFVLVLDAAAAKLTSLRPR